MVYLKVLHDRVAPTLTAGFAESGDAVICEESGDKMLVLKNKLGQDQASLAAKRRR